MGGRNEKYHIPIFVCCQGGTDLEKHRDLLVTENERLKQEMKSCETELLELRKQHVKCVDCEHVQVKRSQQEAACICLWSWCRTCLCLLLIA